MACSDHIHRPHARCGILAGGLSQLSGTGPRVMGSPPRGAKLFTKSGRRQTWIFCCPDRQQTRQVCRQVKGSSGLNTGDSVGLVPSDLHLTASPASHYSALKVQNLMALH